jgi:argininosuccinate synthase
VTGSKMKRIVLAYSGSVATSAAIPWLRERHAAEVVTVTLDLGQERELAAVRERALALGAARAHVIDARDEFVRDYMLPALAAGVLDAGAALPRPLIARRLVDVARMESASAVAHGGQPGSQAATSLTASIGGLDPALAVIVPTADWGFTDAELLTYARSHGVAPPPPLPYRLDASIWGRVVVPSGPDVASEDLFLLTRSPEECPPEPAMLDLEFAAGVPVRANGVEMSMAELIESLETIAGAHGVGRWNDGAAIIEAPAVAVLAEAHRALESFVIGDDLAALKAQLASVYSHVLATGEWFSPRREAIDAFAAVVQKRVTGSVRLELLKGSCTVVSRSSPHAAAPEADPSSPKVTA